MSYCSNCGTLLENEPNFCNNCGHKNKTNLPDVDIKKNITNQSSRSDTKVDFDDSERFKKDKERIEKYFSHLLNLIKLEFYLLLGATFIPIILLTKPNLLYNFVGSEMFHIAHNLKTGSYIIVILLSLGFLFLIFHKFSLKQFKWILIFFFNLIYIGGLLFLGPRSSSYFRARNSEGDFFLNQESIFYGILLICCNIFYLTKIRNKNK